MGLSTKDPDEKIVITFDFSTISAAISNPVVEIRERGSSTMISSMLSGAPQIQNPNKVLQLVQGGVSGKQYDIRCEIDIALTGERFVAKGILPVKS